MKKLHLVIAVASVIFAGVAQAQTYDFTFTGGNGMDATGTFTVVSGVATSGSISVTGVPLEADPSMTTTAAGSLIPDPGTPSPLTLTNHDGDNITFDNVVNVASDPILNGNGLGFASGPYQDASHYSTLINLWGNGPGSYSLFVGEAQLDGNGNVIGDPQWVYTYPSGSLTVTVAPEPSTWALLLGGLGLLAFWRLRQA
ncbi:MAG: PEP-CTERM sorting domain-containing protein [Methylacidiphilales bacterium]|nr:PEP-CTERM sorting domain-containing protein [Candidatus Methylacidiphilales bacterium]